MKHFILSILLWLEWPIAHKSNEVTPAIPTNTLQLTLKNKQVVFPASVAHSISQKGISLYLGAQALDVTTLVLQYMPVHPIRIRLAFN